MDDDIIVQPDALDAWGNDVQRLATAVDSSTYDDAIRSFLTADSDFSRWGITNQTLRADSVVDASHLLAHAAESFAADITSLDRRFETKGPAQTAITQSQFNAMVTGWEHSTGIESSWSLPKTPTGEPSQEWFVDELFIPDGDDLRSPTWWVGVGVTTAQTTYEQVEEAMVVDVAGHTRANGTVVNPYQRWQPGTATTMNRATSASRWATLARSRAVRIGGPAATVALAGVGQFMGDMDNPELTSTEIGVRTTMAAGFEGGGAVAGAWGGAQAGAAAGALIGSIVPGAGTAVGGVIGGIIGGVAGGIVGAEAGDWVHGHLAPVWSGAADTLDAIGNGLSDVAGEIGDMFGGVF